MKIEAVVVCVDYSDFLEYTIADNLQHLDRMVVVTHSRDNLTQRICNKYGVDCIKTEVFHDEGDKFNKGRAINLGLSHLRHDDWILIIDADILLPHRFRHMLEMAKLNKENIYGCDRLNSLTFENWSENKDNTIPQHLWRFMVTPQPEFPLGSRLVHNEYGWLPIGYFQLWSASKNRLYPIVCGSSEHSDVLFAVQWPREKRILLPEFFCYHLESEGLAQMGVNWQGRKTKPFGKSKINKQPLKDILDYETGLKPPPILKKD